jgi:hypothetical protein
MFLIASVQGEQAQFVCVCDGGSHSSQHYKDRLLLAWHYKAWGSSMLKLGPANNAHFLSLCLRLPTKSMAGGILQRFYNEEFAHTTVLRF